MEVDFGSSPDGLNADDGAKYANKRAEIWGAMRSWLSGGAIPNLKTGEHTTLVDELVGPNYGLNNAEAIQLEKKADMRKRGVPSPNAADALACTFAFPVFQHRTGGPPVGEKPTIAPDYNPFDREHMYA